MNTAGQIVDYRSHAMRAKSLCCDGSPYRPVSLAHLRPMIHLLTCMHPVAHAGPTVSLSLSFEFEMRCMRIAIVGWVGTPVPGLMRSVRTINQNTSNVHSKSASIKMNQHIY